LSLLSKAKFRKSFGVGLVIKDKYGVYWWRALISSIW
jgi:hypothetical protein